MKLESWALTAEVISGVAVVITLVLLLLGIRDNTQATYASNYQLLLSEVNDVSLRVAQDDVLSDIRYRYESGGSEALSEVEAQRVLTLYRSLFRIYETAYFANEHDTLGEDEWNRFAVFICGGREQHTDIQWERIELVFSEAFRDFIENDCLAVD